MIVCVSGVDGSGKTVFARRLCDAAARLGLGTTAIAVDDFRRELDWQQPRRSESDIYYEDYFDLEALERAMAAAPAADLLVVEGVLALRAPSLQKAFSIYLDVDESVARARLVERDTARGRAAGEVLRRIEQRYFPAQQRYLVDHDPRARADVLVDNNHPERPRLIRGAPGAWPEPARAPLLEILGTP